MSEFWRGWIAGGGVGVGVMLFIGWVNRRLK